MSNVSKIMAAAVASVVLSAPLFAEDATPVKPAAPAKQTYVESGVRPAKPVAESQDPLASIRQPVDWFKWGADLRLRHEFHENAITLNNDAPNDLWSYNRYRARVWGSVLPSDDLSLNARLVWEGRYWWEPQARQGFDDSYILPDQANVQFRNIGDTKGTITIGRQDIILNDGWLVLEGTPLDGSRTIFFDAARLQLPLCDQRQSIDAAILAQRSSLDDWTPILMSDDEAHMTEQNEWGLYVDYRFKPAKTTQYDAYYIYKNNDRVLANGDDGEIHTVGGRADHAFNDNIRGRIEGAYQFGSNENSYSPATNDDLSAFGITSRLSYLFNDQSQNKLHMNFEFLSGDDPSTSKNEMFDPLWGRWPQFSELYVYTMASETRIAQVTNLYRIGPSWEATPTKKLSLSASYYALFADERTYTSAAYGDGYFRGHLFQAFLRYKFNSYVAGHLWAEYLIPGSYYSDQRDDNAMFLRAELTFTF